MRKAYYALVLALVAGLAIAGCAAVKKFTTDMQNANAPEYMWERQKVTQYFLNGQEIQLLEDAAMKTEAKPTEPNTSPDETAPANPNYAVRFGDYTKALLPVDVTNAIPKDYTKRLDALTECRPISGYDYEAAIYRGGPVTTVLLPTTVLKSKNGDWNRELFFLLNEKDEIILPVEGPKTIMVLSMLSINRDEALDNTRKYIYTIEDENGKIMEVAADADRRNDVLFYNVDAESASTPHVFAFQVPEGPHVYKIRFKYSDDGDILLKFFEAKYK